VSRLAPLIRVPLLSQLWQSAPVLSQEPSTFLLHSLAPQLKQYMALTWVGPKASGSSSRAAQRRAWHGMAASPAGSSSTSDEAQLVMTQPECASWFLGSRQYTSGLDDGAELT
jgi:hypothetical protein